MTPTNVDTVRVKMGVLAAIGAIILIAALAWLLRPAPTGFCAAPLGDERAIFAYYDGCPACLAMKPIVEKRKDVYWLNVLDDKCVGVMNALNLSVRFVPTFSCIKNASIQVVGAMSEEALSEWIKRNC